MKKIFLIFLLFSVALNISAYNKRAAVKTVSKYQRVAKAALDELDTDKAKKNLLKAISLIESYKLTNKEFASIYISAGVLNLMIEDGGEAVSFFKKSLELDPKITIPENFSSEDVDAAFSKAKSSTGKADESFTFDTVNYKIIYDAPKSHSKTKPLKLSVRANPLPPSGYDIQVMFMSGGSKYFESLRLTRSKDNNYVGVIPTLGIPNKELKLYILMTDNDLNPVTMAGSESNPFKIKIIDSSIKNDLNLDLDLDSDSNTKNDVKKKPKVKNDDFPLVSFRLESGTGLGIAHGDPEYTKLEIEPGVAWSPAWIAPDLSFFITPEIMIGVTGRIQIIEKTWNLSLKGQMLIYSAKTYKLFTDFGAGYGHVRYRIDVSNTYPQQGDDIVVHGDIFLWSGVSFVFMMSDNFGISTSAKINLIVPQVSVLIDLGAGFYLEF